MLARAARWSTAVGRRLSAGPAEQAAAPAPRSRHARAALKAASAGQDYLSAGDEPAARVLVGRAVRLLRRETVFTPQAAHAFMFGALACRRLRDLDAAVELMQASYDARVLLDGADSASAAATLGRLGTLCAEQGDHARALAVLEDAHAAHQRLDPESASAAHTMNSLGRVLATAGDKGRLGESVRLRLRAMELLSAQQRASAAGVAQQALRAFRRGETAGARAAMARLRRELAAGEYGGESASLAKGMLKVSAALEQMGERDDAVAVLADAAAMQQRVLGDWHPDLALTLGHLGSLQRQAGRVDEAAAALQRATDSLLRASDDDSAATPGHAKALDVVAQHLHAASDFAGQLALLERLGDLQRDAHDLARLGHTLVGAAKAAQRLGLRERARDLLEEAVAAFAAEFSDTDRLVGQALAQLAAVYGELGQFDMQRDTLERALHVRINVHGAHSTQASFCLRDLGQALLNVGRPDLAADRFERALRIQERQLGQLADETRETRALLESSTAGAVVVEPEAPADPVDDPASALHVWG